MEVVDTTEPSAVEPDTVLLVCVMENRKLRVRFHSYTDAEGKTFSNVYNNSFNCQFPTAIREEGRLYAIHKDDMSLIATPGKRPFYNVNRNGIRVLGMINGTTSVTGVSSAAVARPENVFEVTECVICFDNAPAHIFLPCAHFCSCAECYKGLKRTGNKCPLCRRVIVNII
jgi:hypothetical protein